MSAKTDELRQPMKVLNRGLAINVSNESALTINGVEYIDKDGAIKLGNSAKTSANIIRGALKLDVRPTNGTTSDYAYQIRANSAKTSGTFLGLDNESHLKANGTATLMSTRGVAVLDSGYTSTNGTIIGTYGQARIDGTFNAPAGFVAGLYGLIEASTAITASHVCAGWLDTHQNNAVTGSYEMLYMTNNGTATLDQFIFMYGKADALFSLNHGEATVAYITGPGTAADGNPIKLKFLHNGTPYFLNGYPTDH